MRRSLGLGLAGLLVCATGCEPKVVNYEVKIITSACEAPAPLEGVTHLRVRVTGDGMTSALESVSSISIVDRSLQIPEIPAGRNRVVEVRAYAGEPNAGGKVVSLGRSLPFEVPDFVQKEEAIPINVFLRRVGRFSQPSKAIAPNTCARMINARAGHTATLLQDGRVYIAGGYQQNAGPARSALAKAEFFNPETGGFEDAPEMGIVSGPTLVTLARAFHTATLLNNGQVLLWMGEEYQASGDVNGSSATLRASVLIFDPDQNAYGGLLVQSLNNIVRSHHAAAKDASGRVLIVGGLTRDAARKTVVADKVEWYEPATAAGTPVAKLVEGVSLPRKDMSVSAVQDGKFIAVAGGSDGTTLQNEVSFFTYDANISQPAFVKVSVQQPPRLKESRRLAAPATLNGSNDLVLIGGYSDAATVKPVGSSEVVTTKNAFNVVDGPALTLPRGELCAAVLRDGRILAIGGRTGDGVAAPRSDGTVDLIVPQSSGAISVLGKEPIQPRYNHTCTTLADGSVLVLGGVREANNTFQVLQDALIYMPEPLD